MFARGPRFEVKKPSDVPAPNAYIIPHESILDAHKRGAFLEKADGFNTMETGQETPNASQNQVAGERYVALQKRVDELEKVHQDGKRNHSSELERLKQDLASAHKSAAEAIEKLKKHEKQKAAMVSTIQELKKASLFDQGEIKDLRHKLRLLEIERDKLSSKQPDITALKSAHQSPELKQKDDIRDHDRKIAELEKNLQAEKKRRELQNLEASQLLQEEMEKYRTTLQDKDGLLQTTRDELLNTREKLQQLGSSKVHDEEHLVHRLQQHRSLLETVSQQYGTLASHSASLAQSIHLKQDYDSLVCQQYRLERKLANSEGQVIELTHLIRQTMEEKSELDRQLQDALEHISLLSQPSSSNQSYSSETDDCFSIAVDIDKDLQEEQAQLSGITRHTDALLLTYYRLKLDELCCVSSELAKEHSGTVALLEDREGDLAGALALHDVIASRLELMEKERLVDQEAFQDAAIEKEKLRSAHGLLEVQLADANRKFAQLDSIHAEALKKEKDTVQRLTTAIQKSRMAEEAFRADIDRLTTDLANTEGYQEAYAQLSEQVDLLIARNHLAEEEAERISKLNAQILGHTNPAQRIMYVDRIRTELAAAKLRIAELTREQDALAVLNGELEHELYIYKSVRADSKPRTNLTRVARPPLVNLTHSLNTTPQSTHAETIRPSLKTVESLCEVSHADMTLDELI